MTFTIATVEPAQSTGALAKSEYAAVMTMSFVPVGIAMVRPEEFSFVKFESGQSVELSVPNGFET